MYQPINDWIWQTRIAIIKASLTNTRLSSVHENASAIGEQTYEHGSRGSCETEWSAMY